MPSSHRDLSASQTKRWKYCPGSAVLNTVYEKDEGKPNKYANLGTCVHALIEKCLAGNTDPQQYLDRYMEIVPNEDENLDGHVVLLPKNAEVVPAAEPERELHLIDYDFVHGASCMVEYVRRRCRDLFDTDDVKKLVKEDKVLLETFVNPFKDRSDTGGTADVLINAWPYCVEVVDYKNGKGVFVPVDYNDQLLTYLTGGLLELGIEVGMVETAAITIVQPNHAKAPANGVMSQELDRGDIETWMNDMDLALKKYGQAMTSVKDKSGAIKKEMQVNPTKMIDALDKDNFFNTGEHGTVCKDTFCPFLHRCPAASRAVQKQMMVDFNSTPIDNETLTASVKLAAYDADILAVALPWVPFLDAYAKALKNAADRIAIRDGGTIPGFKVVEGRSVRKWRDELPDGTSIKSSEDKWKQLEERGFTEWQGADGKTVKLEKSKAFSSPEILTAVQLEKMLPKELKPEYNELFIHKPDGALKVAPESDPKEALSYQHIEEKKNVKSSGKAAAAFADSPID